MSSCLVVVVLSLLVAALLGALAARLFLFAPGLGRWDRPPIERATDRTAASPEIVEVHELLRRFGERAGPLGSPGRLQRVRELMDTVFADQAENDAELQLRPHDGLGVRGEWVLAADADPRRRLLYVHGGAFLAGSPKSHRRLTFELARRTGAAVFAVDYRLLPEHSRRQGIADCQQAYRFLLEHGPEGPTPLDALYVAGDSAGGNLTLMLLAWARDQGLRPADAAVALSPATDSTMSSPTWRENLRSDVMLGPLFRPLRWFPRSLLLLAGWLATGIHPRDPRISPLLGDLSRLPPVLVQASECEMLLGDARRWVHKARAAGTPARLQTWPGMVHVWQIFSVLPEASEALDEIERFLSTSERRAAGDTAVTGGASAEPGSRTPR